MFSLGKGNTFSYDSNPKKTKKFAIQLFRCHSVLLSEVTGSQYGKLLLYLAFQKYFDV